MVGSDMVMYEDEFNEISSVIAHLHTDANAKIVFLVDKNGQLIASHGETENIDTTALASLAAGNIAATGGLAQLLGEREFSILFHEGERDNLHISIVGKRGILVVIFDERSSLGLVRLRVKKTSEELEEIFQNIADKAEQGAGTAAGQASSSASSSPSAQSSSSSSPFAEITDEDIDSLFS